MMKSFDVGISQFFQKTFLPKKVFPLLLLFLLTLTLTHAFIVKKTVYGDGIYYFSWLKSVVVDRDINFNNEFSYFNVISFTSSTGSLINKFSIGPALHWASTYIPLHEVFRGTGQELPYQIAVALTSVLFGFTGLLLLYRILCLFHDERSSLATILTIAGATPFLFYGAIDTVNTHAIAFFSVSVFLSYVLSHSPNIFLAGILLGIIGLTRPMDMLTGLLVIPFVWKRLPLLAVGTLIGFAPQLIIWYLQTGTMFVTPYGINQEGFTFLTPHLIETLFSPVFGIFTTSPIVLLSFIGFFLPWKTIIFKKSALALTLMIAVYAISSWSTYWQGETYGNRMFLSFLPLASIPLSFFLSFLSRRMGFPYMLLTTTLPFSLFNAIAIFLFLFMK